MGIMSNKARTAAGTSRGSSNGIEGLRGFDTGSCTTRVDVSDSAIRPLDLPQGSHRGVHELAEVVPVEAQVHEPVLRHVGVGLVAGTYKTHVV